jgi:hypothetical protein
VFFCGENRKASWRRIDGNPPQIATKLAENRPDCLRRILVFAGHHTTDSRAVLGAINASAQRADRGSKDLRGFGH